MPAVMAAIFIDLLGFGIVVPVLPFIVLELGADAEVGGWLIAIYSAMAMITSPLWGKLSDHIGRKPTLIITLIGASIAYLLLYFAESLTDMFLARAFAGAMAGNVAVAMAAAADMTSQEDRAGGMGMIGMAFGLGFAAGPLVGGLVVDPEMPSLQMPSLVAGGLSLLSAITTIVFFREPVRQISETSEAELTFADPVRGRLNKRAGLIFVQVVLVAGSQTIMFSMASYWVEEKLNWTATDVGILYGAIGLVAAFAQGVLIRVLSRKFGDTPAFLIVCLFSIVGFVVMVFVPLGPAMVLVVLPLCGGVLTIATPLLNSILSKMVAPDRQGAALGLANSFLSGGRVIGPLAGGAIFTAVGSDAPFMLAIILLTINSLWAARRSLKPITQRRYHADDEDDASVSQTQS